MAKIEAVITGDINPFKKALKDATEKAREFANSTKDIGKDVVKDSLGGGVGNLLGFAGAAGAATLLGTKIVEAMKEGLEIFGHTETSVLRMRSSFQELGKSSTEAKTLSEDMEKWIEKTAVGTEGINQMRAAVLSLSEAPGFDNIKKIKDTIADLGPLSFSSGHGIDELAESISHIFSGGAEAGEGMSRATRNFPGLAKGVDEWKEKIAKGYETGWMTKTKMEGGEFSGTYQERVKVDKDLAASIKSMTAMDFAKSGMLDSSLFLQIIKEQARTLSKGSLADDRKGSLEAKEAELEKVIWALKDAIGDGLSPAIKSFLDQLNANAPELKQKAKQLGTDTGNVLKDIVKYLSEDHTKPWMKAEADWEGSIWKMFTNPGAALRDDNAGAHWSQKSGTTPSDVWLQSANPSNFPQSPEMLKYMDELKDKMEKNNDLQVTQNELLKSLMTVSQ
jgi:hypothetical protein